VLLPPVSEVQSQFRKYNVPRPGLFADMDMIEMTGERERLSSLGCIPELTTLVYTQRFNRQALQAWRNRADPPADRIIQELARFAELTNIHDLLVLVRKKAVDVTASIVFRDFLVEANHVPPWANFNEMECGQQILMTYDPMVRISFAFGSLLGVGGQFPKMGDVVRSTGLLDFQDYESSQKRLERTGAFIVGLSLPGELHPGGLGHDGILRIRLLHGAVRHFVRQSGKYVERDEAPVNQHDLAITLGLFGYVAIRSLHRLGVRFAQDDLKSYMLLWRFVGFALGISEELLPDSFQIQEEFMLASVLMMGDRCKASGADIRDSFLKTAGHFFDKTWGIVPASVIDNFLLHLITFLTGKDYLEGAVDTGAQLTASMPSQIIMASVHFWARLLSLIDHNVPFGGHLLYNVHLGLIRLMQPKVVSHRLRSRL